MTRTKFTLVISGLILSTSIFAGNTLKNSSINLNVSGVIKPHETLTIATDKLLNDVGYDVVCKIKDPNNAKNPAYIKMTGTYYYNEVNGWPCYDQAKLDQVNNTLVMGYISNYTPVTITNIDNDDTIEVENCVATPSTFW